MNKRKIGSTYEYKAESYLIKNRYKILDKNFYFSGGEIDIIAFKDGELVFVEVKYRATNRYGYASEALSIAKLNKIRLGALKYINHHRLVEPKVRFDAILFDGDSLEHIKNII